MPATKDEIAMQFFQMVVVHGFPRTTVEDVSRALRISKKTIYEHFSSKDEMLRHGLELVAERDRLTLLSQLNDATYLERVLHLIRIILEEARRFWESNKESDLVLYGREIAEGAYLTAFGRLLHDLVEGGVEAGEFGLVDPPMTAELLVSLLMGATRKIQSDTPEAPEAATLEAVRRMLSSP